MIPKLCSADFHFTFQFTGKIPHFFSRPTVSFHDVVLCFLGCTSRLSYSNLYTSARMTEPRQQSLFTDPDRRVQYPQGFRRLVPYGFYDRDGATELRPVGVHANGHWHAYVQYERDGHDLQDLGGSSEPLSKRNLKLELTRSSQMLWNWNTIDSCMLLVAP